MALSEGSDRYAKEFTQSALAIARELDHPFTSMFVHGNFGLAALLTGDTDAAAHAFREELRLCRELVARPFATEGLLGLAGVAVVRGDVDRAARLVGAAEALRSAPGTPSMPGSTRPSSNPPEHGVGQTHGTHPPATAAR